MGLRSAIHQNLYQQVKSYCPHNLHHHLRLLVWNRYPSAIHGRSVFQTAVFLHFIAGFVRRMFSVTVASTPFSHLLSSSARDRPLPTSHLAFAQQLSTDKS